MSDDPSKDSSSAAGSDSHAGGPQPVVGPKWVPPDPPAHPAQDFVAKVFQPWESQMSNVQAAQSVIAEVVGGMANSYGANTVGGGSITPPGVPDSMKTIRVEQAEQVMQVGTAPGAYSSANPDSGDVLNSAAQVSAWTATGQLGGYVVTKGAAMVVAKVVDATTPALTPDPTPEPIVRTQEVPAQKTFNAPAEPESVNVRDLPDANPKPAQPKPAPPEPAPTNFEKPVPTNFEKPAPTEMVDDNPTSSGLLTSTSGETLTEPTTTPTDTSGTTTEGPAAWLDAYMANPRDLTEPTATPTSGPSTPPDNTTTEAESSVSGGSTSPASTGTQQNTANPTTSSAGPQTNSSGVNFTPLQQQTMAETQKQLDDIDPHSDTGNDYNSSIAAGISHEFDVEYAAQTDPRLSGQQKADAYEKFYDDTGGADEKVRTVDPDDGSISFTATKGPSAGFKITFYTDGYVRQTNPDGSFSTSYPNGRPANEFDVNGDHTEWKPNGDWVHTTSGEITYGFIGGLTKGGGLVTTVTDRNGDVTVASPNGKSVTYKKLDSDGWGTVTGAGVDGTVRMEWRADPRYGTESITIDAHPDGSKETTWGNGTTERIEADGTRTVTSPSGAVGTTHPDGTVETVDWHGNQTVTHPDGTSEQKNADGSETDRLKDGWVRTKAADGKVSESKTEQSPNGSYIVQTRNANGEITESVHYDAATGEKTVTAKDGTTDTNFASDQGNTTWTTTVTKADGTTTTTVKQLDEKTGVETVTENGKLVSETKPGPNGTSVTTNYHDGTVTTTRLVQDGDDSYHQEVVSVTSTKDPGISGAITSDSHLLDAVALSPKPLAPKGSELVAELVQVDPHMLDKAMPASVDGHAVTTHPDGSTTVTYADGSQRSFDAQGELTGGAAIGAASPSKAAETAPPAVASESQVASAVERNLASRGLQLAQDRASSPASASVPAAGSTASVAQAFSVHDVVAAAMSTPQPLPPKASGGGVTTHVNLVEPTGAKARDAVAGIEFDSRHGGDHVALNPQPLAPKASDTHVTAHANLAQPTGVKATDTGTGTKFDPRHLGDHVALNPQPLPPKAPEMHLMTSDVTGHTDKVALNPQPLPPKALDLHPGATNLVNPGYKVSLNPQPLLPKASDSHLTASDVTGHTDKVALNPQPLPPKVIDLHLTTADVTSHTDKAALNPQPLPPKASDAHVTQTDQHAVSHYPAGLGHTDTGTHDQHDTHLTISSHQAGHDFGPHDTGHHHGG